MNKLPSITRVRSPELDVATISITQSPTVIKSQQKKTQNYTIRSVINHNTECRGNINIPGFSDSALSFWHFNAVVFVGQSDSQKFKS